MNKYLFFFLCIILIFAVYLLLKNLFGFSFVKTSPVVHKDIATKAKIYIPSLFEWNVNMRTNQTKNWGEPYATIEVASKEQSKVPSVCNVSDKNCSGDITLPNAVIRIAVYSSHNYKTVHDWYSSHTSQNFQGTMYIDMTKVEPTRYTTVYGEEALCYENVLPGEDVYSLRKQMETSNFPVEMVIGGCFVMKGENMYEFSVMPNEVKNINKEISDIKQIFSQIKLL